MNKQLERNPFDGFILSPYGWTREWSIRETEESKESSNE